MSRISKRRTFGFTLIELIVSMAVFVLLSMVVIQLFAATRNIWVRSDTKNELNQDAQMTLDIIDNMLANISHATTEEQGTQFFRVDNTGVKDVETSNDSFTHFSKLYFATKSNIESLPRDDNYRNPIRFVTFQVVEISDSGDPDNGRNCLVMRVISDKNGDKFVDHFPPYAGGKDAKDSNDDLADELDNTSKLKTKPADQDPDVMRLLNNVVAFRVRVGSKTTAMHKATSNTVYDKIDNDELPAFIEITLQLMDRAHYDEYKGRFDNNFGSNDAKSYRMKHAHIFRRYIYFGEYRGL